MQNINPGISASTTKLACSLRFDDGKRRDKVVENKLPGFHALHEWLDKNGGAGARVCIEARGVWEPVAEHLAARNNMLVSVVKPAEIDAFGHLRMTTKKTSDAQLIADFSHERQPEPWPAPSAPELDLRELAEHLRVITGYRDTQLKELNELGDADHGVRQSIVEHIDFLSRDIESAETNIEQIVDKHPELKGKYPKQTSSMMPPNLE